MSKQDRSAKKKQGKDRHSQGDAYQSSQKTMTPPFPHEDKRVRQPSLHWSIYGLILTIFSAMATSAILRVEPLLSANDRSRWATVRALVDEGTYQIDHVIADSGWDTIDKVRHNEHFYSSKPALFPTTVAGVYWIVKKATSQIFGKEKQWNLKTHTAEVTRTVLLIVNLIPMLIALVFFAKLLERHAYHAWTRIFLLSSACFGTYLTTFLVTLNNHLPAALALLMSLYFAMNILSEDEARRTSLAFFWCGFFSAMVCANELPAALFGVLIFLILVIRAPKRTLLIFVPAALIPLAAYFYTNYQCTGGWIPFYAYYGTEKYIYVHEGVPSYWMNPQGLDQSLDSTPKYMLHCLIGHHGLFSLSPIFLLTLMSWGLFYFWKPYKWRILLGLGLLLTLAVFGFYMTRTQNYNYGGNTAGLRWMFWLIPFWLITMIPLLDRCTTGMFTQTLSLILLAISSYSALYSLENPWSQPWLFTLMERWNWIDYQNPEPPDFPHPITTWIRSLPDPPKGETQWIELKGVRYDGLPITRRFVAFPQVIAKDHVYLPIQILWKEADENIDFGVLLDVHTFHQKGELHFIDAQSLSGTTFDIGKSEFDLVTSQLDREFLRRLLGFAPQSTFDPDMIKDLLGVLPTQTPFQPGEVHYRGTFLQRDALKCQHARQQFRYRKEAGSQELLYRCDAVFSESVPFGIISYDVMIADPIEKELLFRQHFEITAASQIYPNADFDSTTTSKPKEQQGSPPSSLSPGENQNSQNKVPPEADQRKNNTPPPIIPPLNRDAPPLPLNPSQGI